LSIAANIAEGKGRGEYGYWAWRDCPCCKGTGYYAYIPVADSHRR